jgi:hypothetical protein
LTRILTWEELSSLELEEPEFWIDPYVVKEGITFVWGKWGRGKSPLTWHMARAIGSGEGFFGLPTKAGKVLYIDVDSPETVAISRIKKLTAVPNVTFVLRKPFIFPHPPREQDSELRQLNTNHAPDVVFLNTLRKCHDLDDKDSRVAKMVYNYWQIIFPHSSLVFVHHDKKESTDPKARPNLSESFSGSQAWVNDAQVALRLDKHVGKKRGRENLRLTHFKSQVSEMLRPLPLFLEKDGTQMWSSRERDLACAWKAYQDGKVGVDCDRTVAKERGISETWARKFRNEIEKGNYPDSRKFLAIEHREEAEDDEVP